MSESESNPYIDSTEEIKLIVSGKAIEKNASYEDVLEDLKLKTQLKILGISLE